MSPMGKVAASPHALPAIGIPSPEADHRAIAELDPSEIELFMEEVRHLFSLLRRKLAFFFFNDLLNFFCIFYISVRDF